MVERFTLIDPDTIHYQVAHRRCECLHAAVDDGHAAAAKQGEGISSARRGLSRRRAKHRSPDSCWTEDLSRRHEIGHVDERHGAALHAPRLSSPARVRAAISERKRLDVTCRARRCAVSGKTRVVEEAARRAAADPIGSRRRHPGRRARAPRSRPGSRTRARQKGASVRLTSAGLSTPQRHDRIPQFCPSDVTMNEVGRGSTCQPFVDIVQPKGISRRLVNGLRDDAPSVVQQVHLTNGSCVEASSRERSLQDVSHWRVRISKPSPATLITPPLSQSIAASLHTLDLP